MDLKWWACHGNGSEPAVSHSCYPHQIQSNKTLRVWEQEGRSFSLTQSYHLNFCLQKETSSEKQSKMIIWAGGKLSQKDMVAWEVLLIWWNWRESKGLAQFLHQLKDLQGPEKLGITTGRRRGDRYHLSLPADKFVIHLQPEGGFLPPWRWAEGCCRLYFYPTLLNVWWPVSEAALCSQARSCWHLLLASVLKQWPAATTKKTLVYPKKNTKKMQSLN